MGANSSSKLKKVAIIILALVLQQISSSSSAENLVKTEVFVSPEMVLGPGFAANKLYYDVGFPGGHIGVKSVNAELVDRSGAPVPLNQAYLHHWAVNRYYAPKNTTHSHHYTLIRNSGICDLGSGLTQCFGVGAETRKTSTRIPHPYGLQVGDPAAIPAGYEEGWVLNVHVIDTRGAEDKMGCVECRCDLYDKHDGEAGLPSGYEGGILCCLDGRRCRVKQGFFGEERSLYLRYIVKYVDWDSSSISIVPVKIYILDVTDVWREGDEEYKGIKATHHCVVEYEVESCVVGVGVDRNGCIHSKTLSVSFPSGGDVIYGIGHQHPGGTGITLYGEGGRTICSSNPIYGEGSEAGNEAGYIVGMSTCYPSPVGTVKILAGETLTLVSNYSSVERHTGVMGLFYLLLADSPSKPLAHKVTRVPNFVWPIFLLGVVLLLVAILAWKGKIGKSEGYESML